MKTPEGKLALTSAMQEKYGFTNSMHMPEVVARVKSTNSDRYGHECTLNTKESIVKKKATWLKNYGVENPSQSLDIFRRKNVKRNRRVKILGKFFTVQGPAEEALLNKLVAKYGPTVATPFSKNYPPDTWHVLHGFPDFYVPSLDLYVECKSTWTFNGVVRGTDHLESNRRKAIKYGSLVRWVIHVSDSVFILLPKDWHTWYDPKLTKFISRRLKND